MALRKIHNEKASVFSLSLKNKKLESDFYVYYINRYLWQLRLAHILALIFFIVAVFAETFLVELNTVSIWLRVGLVAPSFLIGLFITFLFTEFYKKNYQYFNIYYVLITGGSFILSGAHASIPYIYSLYSGLIVCLIFNYTFIRLSFVKSSLAGNTLIFAYIYISCFVTDKADYLTHFTMYIIVVNFLGMFISYLIELDSKRSYLLLKQTKEDAERILTANINLESKVKERTLELSKAKQKAEESDKLKSEFLNNISHEVRTPMNGIIGFTQMLTNPGITKTKIKEYTKIIQNSSNQLLRIINDILEISTLETKQAKVFIEAFCLNELLMEQVSMFSLISNERKIPIHVKKGLPDEESIIMTDKKRLDLILNHIIENGLKFTFKGFIEIGYQLVKNKIKIYVKDTGIGISKENQGIIFQRFSQERKDLSREFGGLGIGLTIAKENARLLGGNITLTSTENEGSTFFITIPYKTALSEATKELTKQPPPTKKINHKVLVVEDEETNYLFIEEVLMNFTNNNFEIIHVRNGVDAVETCINDDAISLVLMDLKMPIMNGFEATRKIKKSKPELPIIAQTAYASSIDIQKALTAGCDDFITKPIDKKEFLDKIFNFVG